MEADILFKTIKSHGLDIQAIEGNLYVSPSAKITDNIRQTIRQHKDALLDFIETYEERAAIMEYGAGLSRQNAETAAFNNIMKRHNL